MKVFFFLLLMTIRSSLGTVLLAPGEQNMQKVRNKTISLYVFIKV